MNQLVLASLESLVKIDHQYRKFKSVWNFDEVKKILAPLKSRGNFEGYGPFKIFFVPPDSIFGRFK